MKFILKAENDSISNRDFMTTKIIFEKKLDNFLSSKNYGEDVDVFMSIIRIFKSPFLKPVAQYSRKEKALVVSAEIDSFQFMSAEEKDIEKIIASSVLECISRISDVRMKPKSFDATRFYEDVRLFTNNL